MAKIGRKSAEQPIWLLVALLLAVVVGIAMFNMISKGTGIFNIFIGQGQGGDTERIAIESFCKSWIKPLDTDINGNINPRASEPTYNDREGKTDVFRKAGWLLSDKDPTTKSYIEPGPPSGCDCIVFLASTAGGNALGPTKAKQYLSEESATGSIYSPYSCNTKAACVAQKSIPELSELFSFRSCGN
ncbi:MAG: hypothetical protein V1820_01185 [archaeon]